MNRWWREDENLNEVGWAGPAVTWKVPSEHPRLYPCSDEVIMSCSIKLSLSEIERSVKLLLITIKTLIDRLCAP